MKYSYEHFTKVRFLCIADYPRNMLPQNERPGPPRNGIVSTIYDLVPHYKKGDVITCKSPEKNIDVWFEETEGFFIDYPLIFKRLEWYENRTIDELICIRYIEVLKQKYHLIGDKVEVKYFIFDNIKTIKPQLIGFNVGGDHDFLLNECRPADKAELLK